MKAIFKADNETTVIKGFIEDHEKPAKGWYETRAEALSKWVEPKKKRAHNQDGTFKADDPATPENEAFED